MGKQAAVTAAARRARLEEVRAQQQRSQRRRSVTIVASTAVVALVAGLGFLALDGRERPADPASIAGVQTFAELSRTHVGGPVTYPQSPPVGGPHADRWQNCGAYPTPISDENAVHSLEHGAVWIAYQPDLAGSDVTALRDLAAQHPRVLLSPYPGLTDPVVVTAWGSQLRIPDVQDPRLGQFVTAYESGAQAPEPGGECTGGVGAPLA